MWTSQNIWTLHMRHIMYIKIRWFQHKRILRNCVILLGLTIFGFVSLCLKTLQSRINRTKTVTHKTEAGNIVSINREIRILSLCTHPAWSVCFMKNRTTLFQPNSDQKKNTDLHLCMYIISCWIQYMHAITRWQINRYIV